MADETEALYREHGAAVAAFCGSLLRDRTEAEDAAQQVFLSAHRALLNGSAPREPLAWLLAVARHECYARFRQRAGPVPAADVPDGAAPDASVHVLRAGALATMWDEVGRMPAAQRKAFLLREVRGLSYGQLADELSLSPPSVRSLLLRARMRLRHRLRDVAAGLGGAPWIQPLVRLVGGGDGASPVPAATKAAAVGIGALALMGGGGAASAPHQASAPRTRSTEQRRAQVRLRHAAAPAAVAVAPAEDRPGFDDRASAVDRSRGRGTSGSRGGSGDRDTSSSASSSSGEGSSEGGDDHEGTATVAAQPATVGHDSRDGDRGPSASSGSDGGSGSSGSDGSGSSHGSDSGSGGDGGSGGSSGGSGDGSDGGSTGGPGG